jgi:hypothetical protein
MRPPRLFRPATTAGAVAMLVGVIALLGGAPPAWARRNDLALLNLCDRRIPTAGTPGAVPECTWVTRTAGTGLVQGVAVDPVGEVRFRSLMSELGMVLAPRVAMPADTLGIAGLQVSGDLSLTRIDHNAAHWNGVEGVSPLNPQASRPDEWLTTVGAFARKGIIPALELGAGAIHLLDSRMVAWQGYAKVALQEGFDDWPLPSLAVRGSAALVTGTEEARLRVFTADLLLSEAFSVRKTARFEPYGGVSFLFIRARSGRLDATPGCDARATELAAVGSTLGPGCTPAQAGTTNDLAANFAFAPQDTIRRYRAFLGAKLRFRPVFIAATYEMAPAGRSRDERKANGAKDESRRQETMSLSAGFDY